jgi:hypothetical protein
MTSIADKQHNKKKGVKKKVVFVVQQQQQQHSITLGRKRKTCNMGVAPGAQKKEKLGQQRQ